MSDFRSNLEGVLSVRPLVLSPVYAVDFPIIMIAIFNINSTVPKFRHIAMVIIVKETEQNDLRFIPHSDSKILVLYMA
jgi:hypothetical protein